MTVPYTPPPAAGKASTSKSVPSILTPSPATSPVAEPNPLANVITSFLGSANVQKVLGLAQVVAAGMTNLEGKGFGQKIAGMTLGGVFALGVHVVDYLRAKIGR